MTDSETAYRRTMLKQKQSLPLEAKIVSSQQRILEWYDHWGGKVYLSFSGGKDSTVLKHLIDHTTGVGDVPAVYVNTGLEYPEIQQFVREIKSGKYDCYNSNIEIVRPKIPFSEVIEKYGYPIISKEVSQSVYDARKAIAEKRETNHTNYKKMMGTLLDKNGNKSIFNHEKWKFLMDAPFKISSYCCDVLKKKPIKEYQKREKRYPMTGQMASESLRRRNSWLKYGCNGFSMREPLSNPVSFWTEQDVLLYLKKYNLPYSKIYGGIEKDPKTGKLYTTGANRTGCMFCMFGVHLEKNPNRFQKMKVTHPAQYNYCMNKLRIKDILNFLNIKYE